MATIFDMPLYGANKANIVAQLRDEIDAACHRPAVLMACWTMECSGKLICHWEMARPGPFVLSG